MSSNGQRKERNTMDTENEIELHGLETIESNLSVDKSEEDESDAFMVFSASGLMVFSASGLMVF